MKNTLDPKFKLWLTVSIIVAILFSFSGLKLAFETPYTVQDDARQHVFWLQRLNDADLFPNDLIADYFSSVAPAGYKFLYWLANLFGLEPFLFNKILPTLLGTGSSIYIFLITVEIFPVPFAGFLSALLLNQNLWLLNDLVSGTPRAFFYVFFLGFIYYLLRQQLLLCLLFIVLQGLFYPQAVLISTGILLLNLIAQKQKRYFYLTCLIVAIAILAIYKLQTRDFNLVITKEAARELPEFYPGGRSSFFDDDWWDFWLVGERSGFFPFEYAYVLLSSFGLLLPAIIKQPRFELVKYLNYKVKIIRQILLVSLGLFCLAHLFLFDLHLPSRYSQHTWRIAIALTNGITLTILLDWLTAKVSKERKLQYLAIAIIIILIPTYIAQLFPYRFSFVTGEAPELYQFLQQQPKDSLIATLSKEGDFIPSLAQRSVLTSREYGIPYHLDYYNPIRQRTKDLIQAQYSNSQTDLTQFIEKYQPDFWAIDKNAFETNYLEDNKWLQQFQPETQNAIESLQQGKPSISDKIPRCRVLETAKLNLLDARCVAK